MTAADCPGEGWWLASDGRCYPPELHPDALSTGPPGDPGPNVVGQPGASARELAQRYLDGAAAEEATATHLNRLTSAHHVLHDLHVPGSSANIDHLVVGPGGVWLIDTKTSSMPLRYSGGTLWRGSHPMRNDVQAVEKYCAAVRSLLGVRVQPVVAVVGQAVPAEARRLGEVQVVEADELVALILGADQQPGFDVESTARLARTLRTPTPLTDRGVVEPDRSSRRRSSSSPQRALRRNGGGPRSLSRGCALSVLAFLMAGIGLLVGLTVLRGLADGTVDRLAPTTTVATPPAGGPSIDVPSPKIGLGATCAEEGAGWQVGFVWPVLVDPQHKPAAYEITSAPDPAAPPVVWVRGAETPAPLTGLAPGSSVEVTATAILADGTRLRPTPSSRVVPTTPC